MNRAKYDFDQPEDRRDGDSYKWNRFSIGDNDVIPAWVADMDFKSPPSIIEALHQRLDGPALGYCVPDRELIDLVVERMQRRYGWKSRNHGWSVCQAWCRVFMRPRD